MSPSTTPNKVPCGYCKQLKAVDAWCTCKKAYWDKRWYEQHVKDCEERLGIYIRRKYPLPNKDNTVINTCDICGDDYEMKQGAIVSIEYQSISLCKECYQLYAQKGEQS